MNKGLSELNRRAFLGHTLGAAAALWLPGRAQAGLDQLGSKRELGFLNLHTNERLRCQYWSSGRYDASALEDIAHILRDFRTNEVKPIHTGLLDLLAAVQARLPGQKEFHVISGYRSPATNAKLSAGSSGVAKRSLHMLGKAIDVRLPGSPLSELRQVSRDLALGGVGYYPKSDFVHLDIGRPRQWIG